MIIADIELNKELFSAANKLRGSIAPSEYKNYVLPLIFLRYLSLKHELRRDEIKHEIIVDNVDKKLSFEQEDMLDNKNEYRKVDVFYIPHQARWEYLVEHKNNNEIKNIIDTSMEILENEYKELEGTLPKVFVNSNIPNEVITDLLDLFTQDIFSAHDGRNVDLLGRVYEYFISNFASAEGNRGGEFFTPSSIVKLLVAMLEPVRGIVYDPACGTGGMFIQSKQYSENGRNLKFIGQEQNSLTIKLAKMNGILHGILPEIKQGDTLLNDQFPDLKAETVISNPPFNMKDWGADRIESSDKRLIGPVSNNNANYMWIQHFLYHLKEGGTAGFVIANGSLTSNQSADKAVRKFLLDNDYVDCVVQLPEKMFFGTSIPSALVFLSKNRQGISGHSKRQKEVLFINANNKGKLVTKKSKVFSPEDIIEIAGIYHSFKFQNDEDYNIGGFCNKVTFETIVSNDYKLTPSLYAGVEEDVGDDLPFDETIKKYKNLLKEQFEESNNLQNEIIKKLEEMSV